MKKLILPFLALLSLTAQAQYTPGSIVTNEQNNLEIADVEGYSPGKITLGSDKKTRGPSRWYDIVDAINESFQGAINVYANDSYNSLWSDSTMLAPFGNPVTYSRVWIRSVAAYFDPVDPRYNDPQFYGGETHISFNDSYTIDSLFLPYIYYRNALKPNVVDTLIVSVIYGDGSGVDEDLDIRFYGPNSSTASNHSTDTLRVLHGFMDLDPNSSNRYSYLSSSPANVRTVRIPLTAASLNDTILAGKTGTGFNYFKIPVNLNVPAGNKAAASIVFKSGDTWTPLTDTLYRSGFRSTPNFNNIRFVAFEETAGGFQEYTKGVWTQSGLMRTGVSAVWGNRHIPCYAFDNTSYEHQWFQWKATCNTCGSVGVDNVESTLSKLSVYPNPTSENIRVQFIAEQELNDASLTLVSLDGAVISSMELGRVFNGSNVSQVVETKQLAAGIYFIQLSASEGKQVEKVVVQ